MHVWLGIDVGKVHIRGGGGGGGGGAGRPHLRRWQPSPRWRRPRRGEPACAASPPNDHPRRSHGHPRGPSRRRRAPRRLRAAVGVARGAETLRGRLQRLLQRQRQRNGAHPRTGWRPGGGRGPPWAAARSRGRQCPAGGGGGGGTVQVGGTRPQIAQPQTTGSTNECEAVVRCLG